MFKEVKKQLQDNFAQLLSKADNLFYVNIDRDVIWDKYLLAFEESEQQGHNCNCCKSFLRQYAGIVAIIDNKRVSIWDNMDVPEEYKASIENVRAYVHSLPITDVFMNEFAKCGTDKNLDSVRNVTWEHFFITLPGKFVKRPTDIDALRGQLRTNKEMLKRSMEELTIGATETVLDLIAQNSLYRGKESEAVLTKYLTLQKQYKDVPGEDRDNWCWNKSTEIGEALCRVRNTAIGTLLINLSENMELDTAVSKFEQVVAPANYKRPTALITPKMIEQAKEKLNELGLTDSLERRYANETDLNVEDIIYTDKSSSVTDVFGEMSKDTLVNPRSFSKVEEISAKDFIEKVIPTTKSLEVLVENSHLANFVSLITSVIPGCKSLFKWLNNFSWSYTGGITDSIKEKVKAAGGKVDGELRVSLSWFNYDDLDLHVTEPNGNTIMFSNKISHTTRGQLDVDMNAGGANTRSAVENIIYPASDRILEGKYTVKVNNFSKRETIDGGYIVQVECRGEVYDFEFAKSPGDSKTDMVVEFNYSKANGITINGDVKSNVVSKEKWGIKTNQFVKVKKVMYSPNHWENATGNKHYMFFLENCVSDEQARPFFNEFLKDEFTENRKVFEVLGSKMKVEHTDNQLSGLGFSETQRNHLIVRVDGNFKRVLKINF